jgi:hypothetical protein
VLLQQADCAPLVVFGPFAAEILVISILIKKG